MQDETINRLLAQGWHDGCKKHKPFCLSEWSEMHCRWYMRGWRAAKAADLEQDRRHPDYGAGTQLDAVWPSVPAEWHTRTHHPRKGL